MTFKMEIVLKKDDKTEIQNQYQMFSPVFSCYSSQKFPLYHTILSIFNYLYFSGLKKKKTLRFRDVKRTGPVDIAESKSNAKSVNSSAPLVAQHPTLPFLECSHYLMQGPWVGSGTWESPRLVDSLSPASPLLTHSCLTSPGPIFITATSRPVLSSLGTMSEVLGDSGPPL